MSTKKGIVKKTPIRAYENIRKSGLQAINLREDDELIEVKTTNKSKDIILVTKNGQCIRFNERDVRATGRASMGVIGMNIDHTDEIIGMQLNTQGNYLLFVSENGMGKRTNINEFTVQRRGGKGVKCYKVNDKTGYVVGVKAVNEENEIMIITTEGIIIRLMVNGISDLGRITSGVKLINMGIEKNITVANIAKVRESNEQTSDEDVIKQLEQELEEEVLQNKLNPMSDEDSVDYDDEDEDFLDEDEIAQDEEDLSLDGEDLLEEKEDLSEEEEDLLEGEEDLSQRDTNSEED